MHSYAMEGNGMEKDFLTVAQVAEVLQVSHATAWRWIKSEGMPASRVGRRLYVARADLLSWVAERKV